MSGTILFFIRVSLAAVWLYNGLWLKVIELDPHHLEIVRSVFGNGGIEPVFILRLIGSCESLLALGIASGLFYRFVSYFQITVILLMNLIGSISGGAISHPFGLVISNLPTIMCAMVVANYGPGAYSLTLNLGYRRHE
ncbi:MAG: DoxX-like family protein [Candidatus Obscuribacterales bacterium]|nr:DoxX-like family protein [Candidatus Obscuribacterales bacterium]